MSALARRLEELGARTGGMAGVVVRHVESAREATLNADTMFPMASVFKFPLAVALLRRSERGELSLDSTLVLTPASLRLGRSPLAEKYPSGGARLTVRELLEYMLVEGDNTAADMLLPLAGGPDGLTREMHHLGIDAFRVDRSEGEIVLDFAGVANPPPAREWTLSGLRALMSSVPEPARAEAARRALDDPRDRASPRALASLFQGLLRGRVLDAADTRWLLGTMQRSVTGPTRIPGALPAGTLVAHRTGNGNEWAGIIAAVNDAGVIALPDGSHLVVVALVTHTPKSREENDRVIAAIARAAYDWAIMR